MPKFEIIATSVSANSYIVEAETEAQAQELFFNGNYESVKPTHYRDYEVESNEDIVKIKQL